MVSHIKQSNTARLVLTDEAHHHLVGNVCIYIGQLLNASNRKQSFTANTHSKRTLCSYYVQVKEAAKYAKEGACDQPRLAIEPLRLYNYTTHSAEFITTPSTDCVDAATLNNGIKLSTVLDYLHRTHQILVAISVM